jgi:hypothetical protein
MLPAVGATDDWRGRAARRGDAESVCAALCGTADLDLSKGCNQENQIAALNLPVRNGYGRRSGDRKRNKIES